MENCPSVRAYNIFRVELDGRTVIETLSRREAMYRLEDRRRAKDKAQTLRLLVNGSPSITFGPGEGE